MTPQVQRDPKLQWLFAIAAPALFAEARPNGRWKRKSEAQLAQAGRHGNAESAAQLAQAGRNGNAKSAKQLAQAGRHGNAKSAAQLAQIKAMRKCPRSGDIIGVYARCESKAPSPDWEPSWEAQVSKSRGNTMTFGAGFESPADAARMVELAGSALSRRDGIWIIDEEAVNKYTDAHTDATIKLMRTSGEIAKRYQARYSTETSVVSYFRNRVGKTNAGCRATMAKKKRKKSSPTP